MNLDINVTHAEAAQSQKKAASSLKTYFPPLEQETRSIINTAAAAFYLNRKPQTLRTWACLENGPIRPRRINGRLAWSVADIRALMSEGGC